MVFFVRISIVLAFCLGASVFAFGQPPSLRCLKVDSLGDVTLTWVLPSDTCGLFDNYYIFFSASYSGPYSLLDSVNAFATNTYLHANANAHLNIIYYYVQSNSGCPNQISDTLQTMFLTINNLSTGLADLTWNTMHDPPLSSAGAFQYVYREDTLTGSMVVTDSISSGTQLFDTLTICDDTLKYQIQINDVSGCASASSIGLLYPDGLEPSMVAIDSVSVDPLTGNVVIGWSVSSSFDVIGYIIYSENNFGGWDSIGFVLGRYSTYYMDASSNPGTAWEIYNVAAFDACGNKAIFGPRHQTLYLAGSLDSCTGEASLSWNSYINWPSGVSAYDIYVSAGGVAYNYLGSTTDTFYTHVGLLKNVNYCYYIRATNNGGNKSSSSNVICGFSDTTYTISNPFVVTGEARDSVKNVLYWNEEPSWSSIIGSYNIFRSYEGSGFVLIGSQSPGLTSYTDSLEPLSYFKYGNGVFCYKVIPAKNSSDMYGCIDTSNAVCLQQYSKFVLPNSFTPNGDGKNDVFMATKLFIDESGYLLTIFNRWGQRIFETTNASEGWDGRYKGFYAPAGVYVYHIKFNISEGSIAGGQQGGSLVPFEKAGTVVLLK